MVNDMVGVCLFDYSSDIIVLLLRNVCIVECI